VALVTDPFVGKTQKSGAVMGWMARRRHKAALRIEPSRAEVVLGSLLLLVLACALAVAAERYGTPGWPKAWRLNPPPPRQWRNTIFWGASAFAVIAVGSALLNGRRWATARRVRRMSEDPALAPYQFDRGLPSGPVRRAAVIGPLEVCWRRGGLPRPPRLRRVTLRHNVFGLPPLRIVYLRLFDNQPRIRTFLQGAWRELGHVHLLRSASSVTAAELRALRRRELPFIERPAQLYAALDPRLDSTEDRSFAAIRNVAPSMVWSFDRYGGYRPRALLCHGSFWKNALEIVLSHVDLAVLDLSGLTEDNGGTLHELQRIVDRVPIQRVIFIADPHSSLTYLRELIGRAWSQMADGSPNAGPGSRRIELIKTDHWVRRSGQRGPNGQQTTSDRVRLSARRRHSRRVAVLAQQIVDRRLVG
jgi:hypothetical protein